MLLILNYFEHLLPILNNLKLMLSFNSIGNILISVYILVSAIFKLLLMMYTYYCRSVTCMYNTI